MMMKRILYPVMITLFLSMFLLVSCNDDDPLNTQDPANLVVKITVASDDQKTVIIQAQADYAVEYQLFIDSDPEPVAVNTTGNFEYTFTLPGNYQVYVRAYGASGRYLQDMKAVQIKDDDPVTIDQGYTTPIEYNGYDLVWNDEFNGNTVNPDNWVFETGDGCPDLCGWGNNELQYYRSQNAWVSDGVLTIEARNELFQNKNFTSARLKTQNKHSFQYGRIDIRALLPKGQGIWPALWMLGNNIQPVGWPACGEIDIMELIGGGIGKDNRVYGTLHWDYNGHVEAGGSYTLTTGTFADEYHVFSIIWDQTKIVWYVNDIQFHVIDITPSHMTEFHQEFFFIFNVAVGGNWPGNPDATTVFPQQMKVDYVRVFQSSNL